MFPQLPFAQKCTFVVLSFLSFNSIGMASAEMPLPCASNGGIKQCSPEGTLVCNDGHVSNCGCAVEEPTSVVNLGSENGQHTDQPGGQGDINNINAQQNN